MKLLHSVRRRKINEKVMSFFILKLHVVLQLGHEALKLISYIDSDWS